MEIWITAVATVFVGALALVGNLYGARKSAEKTEALLAYRMTQLEQKVDKHNNLIERMYCAEKCIGVISEQIKAANQRINDLEHEA